MVNNIVTQAIKNQTATTQKKIDLQREKPDELQCKERFEPAGISVNQVIPPSISKPALAVPKRYLNIFWNQHQPFYKDEARDEFLQPWVRLHATKDYYNMAAILADYPNVHVTINLSSSLLLQLTQYLAKLKAFADVESPNKGDISFYPYGRVDRWLDLMVKDAKVWDDEDKKFAYDNFFSSDYKSQIAPYDGYRFLYDKKKKGEPFSEQDYRDLKVWFNLVWNDSIFLRGPVTLLGETVDGKPMPHIETVTAPAALMKKGVEKGYGNTGFTEQEALSLVLDQYAIMKYVIPVHRMLQNRISPDGCPQMEVVTTPFYHPVLPLIHDTQSAGQCNPGMPLPDPPFTAPDDAFAQVIKGREMYKELFGKEPRGMWPGEGAVSEDVVPAFQKSGIKWVATGEEVLARSGHAYDNGMMYRIDCDHEFLDHDGPNGTTDNSDAMSIVFRSSHDKIGFDYGAVKGGLDGIAAARHFLNDVQSWQHWNGTPTDKDILYTTMADGENCWTNYANNGHDFLAALYGLLNNQATAGGVVTTTPNAYLANHSIDEQYELEPLATGGWVGGEFSTWIGEVSENDAWSRLRITREKLVSSGVPRPDPLLKTPSPSKERDKYFTWKAWEEIYAAEGSDWFWWFGDDQKNNPGWQPRYADDFRMHLINSVTFSKQAGYNTPFFPELVKPLDASNKIMPIPPVSSDPKGVIVDEKQALGSPAKHYACLSIKAGMDPLSTDKIKEVSVNLSQIGIPGKVFLEPVPKEKKAATPFPHGSSALQEKIYALKIQLPQGISPGVYTLPVSLETTANAKSRDFITIEMPPAKYFDIPAYISC